MMAFTGGLIHEAERPSSRIIQVFPQAQALAFEQGLDSSTDASEARTG